MCSAQLERLYSCGSESYICNQCKKLVSRKNILTEEEVVSKVVELVTEKLNGEI
jgi:hypothetical protein